MSSIQLPVIIFVSLIDFMIMFMLVLRGVHSVAGGFFLHHMRAMTRLPLRLLQSSVLLLPPRCLSATLGCQISVISCFQFRMPIQYHLSVFQSVSYHIILVTLQ